MNKRQVKKENKKINKCEIWSVSSYKECREMERAYHEYCIYSYRNRKVDDEIANILGVTF